MLPGLAAVGAAADANTNTVASWRNRYLAQGLDGLADRPRSGCPPVYTPADQLVMWRRLEADPPADPTRWSLSLMARATGISTTQLSRWWSPADLQPHRVRTFKWSDDPRFEARLRDVVAVLEQKARLAS